MYIIHAYIHMYICRDIHVHLILYTYECMSVRMHVGMHVCLRVCIYVFMCLRMHVCTEVGFVMRQRQKNTNSIHCCTDVHVNRRAGFMPEHFASQADWVMSGVSGTTQFTSLPGLLYYYTCRCPP